MKIFPVLDLLDGNVVRGVAGCDDARNLNPEWFDECETVLITAGASAPEVVVQECVDYLIEKFDATVEEFSALREDVHFQLPKELRMMQSEA